MGSTYFEIETLKEVTSIRLALESIAKSLQFVVRQAQKAEQEKEEERKAMMRLSNQS